MGQPPERCDVELKIREHPIGRASVDAPAASAMLTIRALRINGSEYLIPSGGKVAFEAEAGAAGVATLTVTLFPSSLRLVPEEDW